MMRREGGRWDLIEREERQIKGGEKLAGSSLRAQTRHSSSSSSSRPALPNTLTKHKIRSRCRT